MKFKAVIFDLDGTLVDSLADIAFTVNVIRKNRGLPARRPWSSRVGVRRTAGRSRRGLFARTPDCAPAGVGRSGGVTG